MSTIAARMGAVAAALTKHHDLPMGSVSVGSAFARVNVPGLFSGRAALLEVIQWATAFNTELIISLSSHGNGSVETTVDLGGVHVSVGETVSSALAYDLGRLLQRPLSRDISIEITPADLLAVLDGAEVVS